MIRPAVAFALALIACRAPDAPDPEVPDAVPAAADARVETDTFCSATDPRTVPVEVVATPEAGEAPYVDVLRTAQSSIDVEVYLMGFGGILDELMAKAQAGVTVRVILDEYKRDTNQRYFDMLVAAGAEVHWSSPRFTYFHAKFFIVDGAVAVMSTGNYSRTYSIERERNFVATDRDPDDVADLVELFEADWADREPVIACTRMVVSPINARARIIDVIERAQTSLDIESMQFADTGVRDAVRARVEAGVAVRVLLADPDWIDANVSAGVFLQGLGAPARWMPHLHTKAIIADGSVAYVGSENLSYTSLEKNREVGVVVVEPSSIAPMVETFDRDWAIGTAF